MGFNSAFKGLIYEFNFLKLYLPTDLPADLPGMQRILPTVIGN